MVHAWLCGEAVATMILGNGEGTRKSTADIAGIDEVKLPKAFLISETRVKQATFEGRMARFMAG